MTDMNELLSMVENPTRRRILEALAREPHYPLQLSRELGISQPAVVKHLIMLERNGLIQGYQVESRSGPKKTMYTPKSEFTLMVDMRNGMFNARLVLPADIHEDTEKTNDLEETRQKIMELDTRIEELEEERSRMIRQRETLISSMLGAAAEDIGYRHRSLLYEMLNEPAKDVDDLSLDLSMNAEIAKNMIEDIKRMFEQLR